MAEHVYIKFDRPDLFDQYLEETRRTDMPECGDLEIITKPNATVGGKTGVMLTFTVMVKGKRRRVQYTTTLRMLSAIASMCQGRVEFEETTKGPVQ